MTYLDLFESNVFGHKVDQICMLLFVCMNLHLVPDMPKIGLPPVEGAYAKQKKTSLTIHWFQCANYFKKHIPMFLLRSIYSV